MTGELSHLATADSQRVLRTMPGNQIVRGSKFAKEASLKHGLNTATIELEIIHKLVKTSQTAQIWLFSKNFSAMLQSCFFLITFNKKTKKIGPTVGSLKSGQPN